MEVFLYIESRYYHDVEVNLDDVVRDETHGEGEANN